MDFLAPLVFLLHSLYNVTKSCKNNEKRKTARKRHMEEALSCIGKMPIFSGIREEELYTLIKCCDGQMAVFEKTSGSFRQEKNWDISWLF